MRNFKFFKYIFFVITQSMCNCNEISGSILTNNQTQTETRFTANFDYSILLHTRNQNIRLNLHSLIIYRLLTILRLMIARQQTLENIRRFLNAFQFYYINNNKL